MNSYAECITIEFFFCRNLAWEWIRDDHKTFMNE